MLWDGMTERMARGAYMADLLDKTAQPTLEEIGQVIQNPIFAQFCSEIKGTYKCKEKIEFSSCSWEMGWNIKFKKAGKTLCTIYPRKLFFAVLVVVGEREKELVESILPGCTVALQRIYRQTKVGNGQRWLMIEVEKQGDLYDDVLRLICIRSQC